MGLLFEPPSSFPTLTVAVEELTDSSSVIGFEAAAALGFTAWYLNSYTTNHKLSNSFRYSKSNMGDLEKPPNIPTTTSSSGCPTGTGQVSPYDGGALPSDKPQAPSG